ncbi:MAG: ATP-binding protein [Myxococcota bacterium]
MGEPSPEPPPATPVDPLELLLSQEGLMQELSEILLGGEEGASLAVERNRTGEHRLPESRAVEARSSEARSGEHRLADIRSLPRPRASGNLPTSATHPASTSHFSGSGLFDDGPLTGEVPSPVSLSGAARLSESTREPRMPFRPVRGEPLGGVAGGIRGESEPSTSYKPRSEGLAELNSGLPSLEFQEPERAVEGIRRENPPTLPETESPELPTVSGGATPLESASLQTIDEGGLFIERATTVRVDVAKLDSLLNLMGDLLQEKHRHSRLVERLVEEHRESPDVQALVQSHRNFDRLLGDLQDAVLSTRMLPVQGVFRRYPRIVKDLAARLGKEVELVIAGEQTELDRALLEGLFDPLIHLLRNSIDHGIEAPLERVRHNKSRRGMISLSASQEGNQIVLEIRDDGRGIDPEEMVDRAIKLRLLDPDRAKELNEQDKIDLIFLSGFTSRPDVTETSGRGVGMSVVRDHLRRIGGLITVQSRQGEGTTLRIAMPLTLAILQVLLVRVGRARYALPLSSVVGAHRVERNQLTLYRGGWYLPRPGSMLPLFSLATLLGVEPPQLPPERCYLAEIGVAEKRYGVWVDGFEGIFESVIKSLEGSLTRLPGVAGGTFVGSGELVLVLDVGTLLEGQLSMKPE